MNVLVRTGNELIPPLQLSVIAWLIQISCSSLDSSVFVRLPAFDGYLHKMYNLTNLIPVTSKIECASICMKNPECGSFFYIDQAERLCQTHSVLFLTTVEAVPTSKVSYYQLTQAEKKFLTSHPETKEKVINIFAQNKTRRMDFIFKWVDQAGLEQLIYTPRCPYKSGYILYRPVPLCYRYFPTQVSWTVAKQNCQGLQNHLIDVKTPNISAHLVNFLRASSTTRGVHVSAGASLTNGVWTWSDGTIVRWTNWAPGEPSSPAEKCLALAYFYYFQWNDVPCTGSTSDLQRAYICQLNI